MNTLLVWVMVATTQAAQPAPPTTQFASLADCTRMISALTQSGRFAYRYQCVSTRVVNPYATDTRVIYQAPTSRGQRNADYNQQKLDDIIHGR